jgi:hypothetical protein
MYSAHEVYSEHSGVLTSHQHPLTDYLANSSSADSMHGKCLPCLPVNCTPGAMCCSQVLSVLMWMWGILLGGPRGIPLVWGQV